MNIQLFPIGLLRINLTIPTTQHEIVIPAKAGIHYDIRNTKYERRETINMQNKPNLLNAQMNVTSALTKDYENVRLHRGFKKQTQSNPISNFLLGRRNDKSMAGD